MHVHRQGITLSPDPSRVYYRPLQFSSRERVTRIVARVTALEESEVEKETQGVLAEFGNRHQDLVEYLISRYESFRESVVTDRYLSKARKILLGACFTQEYALEAAALFNPSMVPHPDQSGVAEGSRRFILSLRATGEGHISSIVFRQGIVDRDGGISLEEPVRYVTQPEMVHDSRYDGELFMRKLAELGLLTPFTREILSSLGSSYTYQELEEAVTRTRRYDRTISGEDRLLLDGIMSLADANYEVRFRPSDGVSARVIAPRAPSEVNGIEDARFVLFHEDDGRPVYFATYTAFDGKVVLPQLLETRDFLHFSIRTLNGREIQNKGLALFPRKIGGRFAMISRQDNENLFLMYSDSIHFWQKKTLLLRPTFPWEYVQIGNCGSPVETEAGWILLTHGVGPMRKYSIGAVLLDRDDPSQVTGRLPYPLLSPLENEREGYVPNVVYSCGAMALGGTLIIPYAMSDQASGFATVDIGDLVEELLSNGPLGDRRNR